MPVPELQPTRAQPALFKRVTACSIPTHRPANKLLGVITGGVRANSGSIYGSPKPLVSEANMALPPHKAPALVLLAEAQARSKPRVEVWARSLAIQKRSTVTI